MNSPDVILSCLCDLKGFCLCPDADLEKLKEQKRQAFRDYRDKLLRRPVDK